jgi:ferredoxin-NADP reductase
MADQTATLIRREEVAEGTMAFHFEKPSAFRFTAGQSADVINRAPETITQITLSLWPGPWPLAQLIAV